MTEKRLRNSAIGLLILALVATVIITILLTRQFYSHSRNPHHEIPWLASQLETEYLRSVHELELFVRGEGDYEEAVLRFDIFWSRFNVIIEGADRTGIASDEWKELVPVLGGALADLDDVLGDPEKLKSEPGRKSLDRLKELWKPLRRFTKDAVRDQWTRHDAQHQYARSVMVALLALVLVLVLLVSGRILLIERGRRELVEREYLARLKAETAVSDRERLMASVSHELRTPLNAIIGFSEIMKTERFGPLGDRYQTYATDIHRSGEHLLHLVNQVLDLSTIRAGERALEPRATALDETLRDAIRTVSPLAAARNQSIGSSIEDGLSAVADPRAVKQIVLNLLSNALKFTPDDGHVQISAGEETDGSILIEVADSGSGISEHDLSQVLEPFYRSKDPHVAGTEGAGLGLSISRSLADEMGFELSIASKVGFGTRASLLIPRSKAGKEAGMTAEQAGSEAV